MDTKLRLFIILYIKSVYVHTLPYKKKPTMSTNDNVGFLYLVKTTIMSLPKLQA